MDMFRFILDRFDPYLEETPPTEEIACYLV